jgi:hypothetical protein
VNPLTGQAQDARAVCALWRGAVEAADKQFHGHARRAFETRTNQPLTAAYLAVATLIEQTGDEAERIIRSVWAS